MTLAACAEPTAPPLVEEAVAAEVIEAPVAEEPDPFAVYFDPLAVSGFRDPGGGVAMAAGRVSSVASVVSAPLATPAGLTGNWWRSSSRAIR